MAVDAADLAVVVAGLAVAVKPDDVADVVDAAEIDAAEIDAVDAKVVPDHEETVVDETKSAGPPGAVLIVPVGEEVAAAEVAAAEIADDGEIALVGEGPAAVRATMSAVAAAADDDDSAVHDLHVVDAEYDAHHGAAVLHVAAADPAHVAALRALYH